MSEVIGKIIQLGQTETVGSAGTFQKRLLVVETNEQYSQKVPIDFLQAKCELLDNYKVGDDVKVSVNIRGNEYNGKYYVSLNGWRIDKENASTPTISNEFAPPVQEEEEEQKPPF